MNNKSRPEICVHRISQSFYPEDVNLNLGPRTTISLDGYTRLAPIGMETTIPWEAREDLRQSIHKWFMTRLNYYKCPIHLESVTISIESEDPMAPVPTPGLYLMATIKYQQDDNSDE